ncbi:MAG: hypothetical protein J1E58_01295 [Prevotella sp.]|nr:hypothetical protein [Prevotella sp.]
MRIVWRLNSGRLEAEFTPFGGFKRIEFSLQTKSHDFPSARKDFCSRKKRISHLQESDGERNEGFLLNFGLSLAVTEKIRNFAD